MWRAAKGELGSTWDNETTARVLLKVLRDDFEKSAPASGLKLVKDAGKEFGSAMCRRY